MTIKQIVGNTTDDLWQQISTDLSGKDVFEYNVLLVQNGKKVELMIDIDLGGGFESGSESTSFTALISPEHDFRFALHHKGLIDSVGKFLGMEDVVIGYPEFDEAIIIKTNDKERVHGIFSDANVRETFMSIGSFTLCLTHHHEMGQKGSQPFLELSMDKGITDPTELRRLYEAFYKVLCALDA